MSALRWAGPYTHALDATGARLEWDPINGGSCPKAARYVVRWRIGSENPRKRTFTDLADATDLARQIAAAKLLGSAANPDGTPASGGAAPVEEHTAAPQPHPLAAVPAPSPPSWAPPTGPAGVVLPGVSIADYIDHLIRENQPRWEDERQATWWIDELTTLKACFTYAEGDPRIGHYGIRAGDSKHFALLNRDLSDFSDALAMRRSTNLQAAHRNRQRAGRFARLQKEYKEKLAAWNARTRHKGRKPVPPKPPLVEVEFAKDRVLISTNTEKAFRTAFSFVFDRAYAAGLMPYGADLYRQWNPRGSGGRRTNRATPFRPVTRATPHQRDYPGAGFWVDLGDVMATIGEIGTDGAVSGERYRILPLVGWQLATRPGELLRLHVENIPPAGGEALIEPEPGYHLKARDPGQVRRVPVGALVSGLIHAHVTEGLAGDDGLLFVSPRGLTLNPGNFYDTYLRPALAAMSGESGLWGSYPALVPGELRDLRKAGITNWLAQGADSLEAAAWAGHTEQEQMASYRGLIAGVGRRNVWENMDIAVENALRADPPRGDGMLAEYIRNWLGIPKP